MSTETANVTERKIAQQAQEKFELYLLGLVFTLLGLAVQTATFGPSLAKAGFELVAWVMLLISGLAGLWRLQWLPVLRVHMADQSAIEEEIYKLKELQMQGQAELTILDTGLRQPIAERIGVRTEAKAMYDPIITKLERRNYFAFGIHKVTFIFGLICLIAARGYDPLLAIARHLIP